MIILYYYEYINLSMLKSDHFSMLYIPPGNRRRWSTWSGAFISWGLQTLGSFFFLIATSKLKRIDSMSGLHPPGWCKTQSCRAATLSFHTGQPVIVEMCERLGREVLTEMAKCRCLSQLSQLVYGLGCFNYCVESRKTRCVSPKSVWATVFS